MSDVSVVQTNAPTATTGQRSVRRLIQMTSSQVLWIGALFAGAGRLDWVRGWICVALYLVGMTAILLVVRHYNAPLMEARAKWRHKDTKRFDKVFFVAFMPLVYIQPAIAGLDAVRFRWSSMPFGLVFAGATLFALAIALISWSMAMNPYAEVTVRIQTDRGHKVVTSGPYRIVRHPLYVGTILMYAATSLILGSFWALALTGLMSVLFIVRTALEDQTLRKELSGYEEYAARTRYRLFPGLW